LLSYTIFMVFYFFKNPSIDYSTWSTLHDTVTMKIFSLATLISLGAHAWLGVWAISTDYLKTTVYRILFQVITAPAILIYVIWGAQLLWNQ
jgi:succinate dehydrogenase / fumarate reductase membrane anchor subunit